MALEQIIAELTIFKYLVLFPIAVVEGPIITVLAAFLATRGVMNIYLVFVTVVLADMFGDVAHYALGKYGQATLIPKYGKYFGVTESRLRYVESKFERANIWKTIFIGKYLHAPNSVILTMAGIAKVDIWQFMVVTTAATIPKVIIFMVLGWYFGKSYELIGAYIDTFSNVVIGGLILAFVLYGARRIIINARAK